MGEFVNVHKELGRGTFGKVRLAIHPKTGEKVAIKTIYKQKYDKLQAEYPPRELSIVKCLRNHSNIAQVFEIITLRDRVHIVMEYVEGKSLAEVIPREGIEEKYARRIFREILIAVEYIHSKNIVHRDLKLDNILLNNSSLTMASESMIKIVDFGFSSPYDENQLLTTMCGTQEYLAPEIMRGTPYNGVSVDIWALGVILYTMVIGTFPFPSPFEAIETKYSFPETTRSPTSSFRDLISKIFIANPQQRISLHQIMKHPWVNEEYSFPPSQPYIDHSFDRRIIQLMKKMGYQNPESSILELTSATTVYYLTKKKLCEQDPVETNSPPNQFCAIS